MFLKRTEDMRITKKLTQVILVFALSVLPLLIAAQKPPQQFQEQREAEQKRQEAQTEKTNEETQDQYADIKLPQDNTPVIKVKLIQFGGNTLITTTQLIDDMPVIFNASDKPLAKAESKFLYNLSPVKEVLMSPGTARDISARTIQGLAQYVLSEYQRKNYGGIYVYVPADALKGGVELKEGILPVTIIEAHISDVNAIYYDPNQNVSQKKYLDPNLLVGWSPAKPGEVLNSKKLNDYINLLNLNPDRYVSATVSGGSEANTLAVNYGVYEASPWHYFIQVDNSGVEGREWNPKIGVINTNLLGRDDSFLALYQFPWDSDLEENYSLFGSYDFPLTGPELRLNIYGGYSAYNLSPQDSSIDFIGAGKFLGANLKYNVMQRRGWFFDLIGSISVEESKITSFFGHFDINDSDVRMHIVGFAADLYRRDDISSSFLEYRFSTNTGGSSREEFNKSRPTDEASVDKYFTIHTFSANYSRILDPNKVTRLSTTAKWIITPDRLPPAKMTPFGGMYSVRGYEEYETIADEGFLASIQYEYDIVRHEKTKAVSKEENEKTENSKSKFFELKKLAPLAFLDFGRTEINDPTDSEKRHETFLSIGPGVLAEMGDYFSAGLYWGIALRDTELTDAGDSRVNVSFMARW